MRVGAQNRQNGSLGIESFLSAKRCEVPLAPLLEEALNRLKKQEGCSLAELWLQGGPEDLIRVAGTSSRVSECSGVNLSAEGGVESYLNSEGVLSIIVPLPEKMGFVFLEGHKEVALTKATKNRLLEYGRVFLIGTPLGQVFNDRFECQMFIQDHGEWQDYLGYDRKEDQKVLIRVQPRSLAEKSDFFAHQNWVSKELTAKRVLNTKHLCAIDRGFDLNFSFFISPFIEGPSLKHLLKDGSFSPVGALEIVLTLAETANEVHSAGFVHGNLKPSNIILENGKPHAARMVNLYGAKTKSPIWGSASSVDSLYYSSPESLGLIPTTNVDSRSDIYSLGLIFLEMLTGKTPIEGEDKAAIFSNHLKGPSLKVDKSIPDLLVMVIQRMISVDPEKRYQSFNSLLRDLRGLSQVLSSQNHSPLLLGEEDLPHQPIGEPQYLDIYGYQAVLAPYFDNLKNGSGGAISIEGIAGTGKTRLLNEICKGLRSEDFVLYRAQGTSHTAPKPFEVLSAIVSSVVERLKSDQEFAGRWKSFVGPYGGILRRIFPTLIPFVDGDESQAISERGIEDRFVEAVGCLLQSLGGGQKQPAIVIIDDAQWIDPMTLRAINHWTESRGGKHCMVVFAFRPEEVSASHLVRLIKVKRKLTLRAMEVKETESLCASMAGVVSKSLSDSVHVMAGGNPFMVTSCLRGLIETGKAEKIKNEWQLVEKDFVTSRQGAILLRKRLDLLSDQSTKVLARAAVFGKQFDLSILATLCNCSIDQVIGFLSSAVERNLVVIREKANQGVFAHDLIRESVNGRLSDEEQKTIHLEIASAIKKQYPSWDFEIAHHYHEAGDPKSALPYALSGFEKAKRQNALDLSVRLMRIAEEATVGVSRDLRFRVLLDLSKSLLLTGAYSEALRWLKECEENTSGNRDKVKVKITEGELYFKHGQNAQARKSIVYGLSLLGVEVPDSQVKIIWGVLKEILFRVFQSLALAVKYPFSKPKDITEEAQLQYTFLSRLGYIEYFGRGVFWVLWSNIKIWNIAAKYKPSVELARGLYSNGFIIGLLSRWDFSNVGIKFIQKSIQVGRKCQNHLVQGQAAHFLGALLYCTSRYRRALRNLRWSEKKILQVGDQWELNLHRWHQAYCHYRLGELDKAIALADTVFDYALQIGDYQSAGIALSIATRSRGGNMTSKHQKHFEEIKNKLKDDIQSTIALMQAQGIKEIYEGKYNQAIDTMTEAKKLVIKSRLMREYSAPIFMWLTTAMRKQWEATRPLKIDPKASKEHRAALEKLNTATKKAVQIAKRYPNNLPHAYRERALAHALWGNLKAAKSSIDKSIHFAEQSEARYEWAVSLLVKNELAKEVGWKADENEYENALRVVNAFNLDLDSSSPSPVALLARFEALVNYGSQVSVSRKQSEVLGELQKCVGATFLSPYVGIFRKTGNQIEQVGSGNTDIWSREVANRILSDGEVVVLSENAESPKKVLTDDLVLGGIKSAVYAPITVGEETTIGFCVHSEIASFYGDDDLQIAQFVAQIAGSGLEVAKNTRSLKEANVRLEDKVQQLEAVSKSLAKARRQAEVANIAKSNFLAMVSHELRTPLAAILGYTNLLKKSAKESDVYYLEKVTKNSGHLLRLLNDLLDLSKIETGTLVNRPGLQSLEEIFEGLSDSTLSKAQSKEIDLRVKAPNIPGKFLVDKTRLLQVLINLVDNAIKFTPKKGRVEVLAEYQTGKLTIDISDTGAGIAVDQQAKIFEPFFQVESGYTRSFEGSGLGLAVSYKIASALGGSLELVSSKISRGSCFRLIIPVTPENSEPQTEFLEKQTPAKQPLVGKKLLVVDDNPDISEIMQDGLTSAGAHVILAGDGEQALQALDKQDFDFILMDISMPVMDGYTATKEIRNRGISTPIVAVTAHASKDEERKAYDAGVDSYVTKPFDVQDLVDTIGASRA